MKPTYLGYSPEQIKPGDRVVSYPHHKTKERLHGDVVSIDREKNELRINYNRTEHEGRMIEKGYGMATLKLSGYFFNAEVSTSLDVELILRG